MDINSIIFGTSAAGGGGLILWVIKFMVKHTKDITTAVDKMSVGLEDIKEQVSDLKTDMRDQVRDIKNDVSQLRDHVHNNEIARKK